MAIQRSNGRAVREKFRKRTPSWAKKGNELAKIGADLYWVMYYNDKFFTYKSTDRPGWPPSEQDIMKHTPPPLCRCPKDFETMNEEKCEDDDEREGDGAQAEESEFNRSRESDPQEASEKNVDQGRRVFTIPKVPVLQRLSTLETSHIDDK